MAAKPPTALKLTKALMRGDPAAIAARIQAEGKHVSAQLVPPDFSKVS